MTVGCRTAAFALGAVAALLLAACAGRPQPAADSSTDPTATRSATQIDSPAAEQQAALPRADSNSSQASKLAAVALEKLPGMSGDQVISILGRPQFLRDETSAALWQYRGDGCILNLFLYSSGNALRVRHAEVQSRPAAGTAADFSVATGAAANECLAKLAAAHAHPTS